MCVPPKIKARIFDNGATPSKKRASSAHFLVIHNCAPWNVGTNSHAITHIFEYSFSKIRILVTASHPRVNFLNYGRRLRLLPIAAADVAVDDNRLVRVSAAAVILVTSLHLPAAHFLPEAAGTSSTADGDIPVWLTAAFPTFVILLQLLTRHLAPAYLLRAAEAEKESSCQVHDG
jgi:hypothetical protein